MESEIKHYTALLLIFEDVLANLHYAFLWECIKSFTIPKILIASSY
jgi:hypothetical protein